MFTLAALLSTRHPKTGFLGSLSKDFAQLITLQSIIFQSGLKETFLSLSLSVNLAFITFQCLSIWSFAAFFSICRLCIHVHLLLAINPVKCRGSNTLILCSVKSFNFFKDDMFLTYGETFFFPHGHALHTLIGRDICCWSVDAVQLSDVAKLLGTPFARNGWIVNLKQENWKRKQREVLECNYEWKGWQRRDKRQAERGLMNKWSALCRAECTWLTQQALEASITLFPFSQRHIRQLLKYEMQ